MKQNVMETAMGDGLIADLSFFNGITCWSSSPFWLYEVETL
jgi:hypothetical protein